MSDGDESQSPLDRLFADLPTHLSVEDLMALLGLGRATVYRLLHEGALPAYRAGVNWVILRDEVREFFDSARTTAPTDPPTSAHPVTSGRGPGAG